MRDYVNKTETILAAVRAGGDLQVCIIRWDDPEPVTGESPLRDHYHATWEVQAFDSDGNPMMVLGAFLDEATTFAMFPQLITLAREAYGSERTCVRAWEEFSLTAWRVKPQDNPHSNAWEWSGTHSLDDSLSNGLGETNRHYPYGGPTTNATRTPKESHS